MQDELELAHVNAVRLLLRSFGKYAHILGLQAVSPPPLRNSPVTPAVASCPLITICHIALQGKCSEAKYKVRQKPLRNGKDVPRRQDVGREYLEQRTAYCLHPWTSTAAPAGVDSEERRTSPARVESVVRVCLRQWHERHAIVATGCPEPRRSCHIRGTDRDQSVPDFVVEKLKIFVWASRLPFCVYFPSTAVIESSGECETNALALGSRVLYASALLIVVYPTLTSNSVPDECSDHQEIGTLLVV
jgi:hypothetical protein